eukprot:TRINITY_DN1680_c0_g1_i12.p1 TRINITY_DN1680_c0_g1~~TRINITY_DN1680_c0_g1_i12.p1  ORF type:complete len:200 (-),score=38.68 TRINITY_DN1680_c0_g1_i12:86-685(-)
MDELADEISKGVDLLKDANKFSDEAFTAIVKLSFAILTGEENEDALAKSALLSSIDGALLKQTYATLTSLILQFSKLNADSNLVEEYLTESQVSKPRVSIVTDEYKKYFGNVRQMLWSTGFNFPHIVDVQWRCDYVVKTNSMERLNLPVFFVKLKVADDKSLRDVEFTCNLDQLQDLVSSLKDATVSLERLDMYQSTEQ